MSTIIPRWEWRTFGEDLSAPGARLAALAAADQSATPPPVQSSEEVYLLSSANDANVKVRDDLMDIKALEQTNGDGLEQWRPVLKAGFPLPATTLGQVFTVLGLSAPTLARAAYSLDELTHEIIAPEPRLQALAVHKERTRYRVDGCMTEWTRVTAGGRQVQTLAVESEDAAAVLALVQRLGLAGVPNQSYPRGLKALGADTPKLRIAVIDLGTNSVKFYIGERDADGRWQRIQDRAQATRLGDGLRETGLIAPAAWERTLAAICAMAGEARAAGVAQIVAVGTMGMRTAKNSDAFIAAVQAQCGVAIEVIDGADEARLAYLAVQAGVGLPDGAVIVFDTGGGSTQVTVGRAGQVLERFSLDLGAVRVTEQFGLGVPVGRATLDQALAGIGHELARLDSVVPPDALVGLGGAVTNLVSVSLGMTDYDPDHIQGAILTRAEIERQIALYAGLDGAGRAAIPGLQPGRADIILAGALIVLTLLDKLRQGQLMVSDRGLRHGVLIDRFSA
jgi:exopolyphosphatase/guanosine-5'-triphosphate,3'-diphosphate pyrophosphatase